MSGTDTRLLVVGGAGSLYVNKEHTFCLSVSIRGKVKEIGFERLQRLLDKNPYMYEIYPTEQSRTALMVFCLYEGQGEWFDLSKKPIERFSFSFGGGRTEIDGYFITDDCIGCGKCLSVCPQSCIVLNGQKASIKQENCLHCGNCINICPMKAVVLESCKSTPRA